MLPCICLTCAKPFRHLPHSGRTVIGDPQVRNRGTLGGSIANSDPSADYPAAVVGLKCATVHTNSRTIAADDFFKGLFETALNPGELITKVSFPVPKRAAYMKFANPASRYAVVGVMVAETTTGIRVAVTGAGRFCVSRRRTWKRLWQNRSALRPSRAITVPADDLNNDMHAHGRVPR